MERKLEPLKPEQLRRRCGMDFLPFETTNDLEILDGVIEQERAVVSLKTGLSIDKRNFNIFVAGASGTGRTTIVRSIVSEVASKRPVPPDWVYVQNFKEKESPVAIRLPAGKGRELAEEMERLVEGLRDEVPKVFRAKEHQEEIQEIVSESLAREQEQFTNLSKLAGEVGFSVKSTKTGLITVPMVEGKLLSNKEYDNLSDEDKAVIEERRRLLDPMIHEFVAKSRSIETVTQEKIKRKQLRLAEKVTSGPIRKLKRKFNRVKEVKSYLEAVQRHMIENLGRFMKEEGMPATPQEMAGREFVDYQVNVLVDNSELSGSPVIIEARPNYYNLFGKIEKKVENGVYFTDFTLVKAGSVLKANGGYLLINTNDLFAYGLVWENLKSVLRYRQVAIEDIGEHLGYLPTSGLKPQPVPIDLKIILVGPPHVHEMLHRYDEDFRKLFQVKSEFDYEMRRGERNVVEYARFVATTCKNEKLRPVTRDGVASVVEFGSRLVESQNRVTLQFNQICNLLIEADVLAAEAGSKVIDAEHVARAEKQRAYRMSLVEEKIREDILDGTVFVDTDGKRVGVINGLAVYEIGDYTFGKPSRITSVVWAGKSGVINIERESRLSGRIHSKGVMIISGYLGAMFGQLTSPSLSVSVCFEQSYGPIDGDSASGAELFSILSALAGVPIRQDFAVTGSVNQHGEIQPVGGINEKIEAWFDLCQLKGLTGTQGVMIPRANVGHLMLKHEVVEAVAQGLFSVVPISTVEEGLEVLTGVVAGGRTAEHEFLPEGSILALAAARIASFDADEEDEEPVSAEGEAEEDSGCADGSCEESESDDDAGDED